MSLYGAGVEYALHTVLNLSRAPAGAVPSARDLADFQRLPLAFMRKLLTQLEKGGVVMGAEGVRGGWRLARGAHEITLLQVVDAVQGRAPLFDCREIRTRCALWNDGEAPPRAIAGVCTIHAAMLSAEAAMRRELGARTLADIACQVVAKDPEALSDAAPTWFAERYHARRALAPDPAPTHEQEGRP